MVKTMEFLKIEKYVCHQNEFLLILLQSEKFIVSQVSEKQWKE